MQYNNLDFDLFKPRNAFNEEDIEDLMKWDIFASQVQNEAYFLTFVLHREILESNSIKYQVNMNLNSFVFHYEEGTLSFFFKS